MLLLDSRSAEINGFTVHPDHADPQQWYYAATSPHLTMVRDETLVVDAPQMLLVGYRGDAGDGGLLNFDVNVGATQDQLDDLAQQIAAAEHLAQLPRLAPVPLVGGTVKLLALGKQTSDFIPADPAQPAPVPGATDQPEFVLKIDHNAEPSLYGSNQASFSVQLDADGFTMIEQCLDGEILPVAVIYSLDYWGLRPAYAIKLTIDWDRVQKHLDETFSTSAFFVSSDISKVVDELVEQRAIVLEADTFVPEGTDTASVIDRRDAALALVRNMITDNFFTVSIPPWKPADKDGWEKALDAVGKFAAESAVVAAGGPAAGLLGSVSFSYKKTDYTRIDRLNLNVDLSERTTVVRSIHPQAHLAALTRVLRDTNLPRERFVKHVDLTNDWFTRRRLKVSYRPGLGSEEIDSINVRAAYGNRPANAILTAPDFTTSFEWLSQLNNGQPLREVDLSYEVAFKDVDTSERPGSLTFAEPPTTDVEATVRPEEDLFSVKPIPVLAENFPWDRYSSVEVHLRYTDPANELAQTDLVRLTKEQPDGVWKLFVLDRTRTGYERKILYRALDNRDHTEDFVPVEDEQITVRNPFPSQRVLDVTAAAIDWSVVRQAFLDVRYSDPENHVLKEDSFSFEEGSAGQRFVVDLRDPAKTDIFYVATFIMADHSTVTVPESMTRDRRIALRPDMVGRRAVTVRPPVDFASRRLRRVTVNVRFEDFSAGLSFADTYDFTSGTDERRFEYDVVDEHRMAFEYSYKIIFENGLVRNVDWVASEATEIRPTLQAP